MDTHKLLRGFWHTNESPNLGQKTEPYYNQLKKSTHKIVDFAVPHNKTERKWKEVPRPC